MDPRTILCVGPAGIIIPILQMKENPHYTDEREISSLRMKKQTLREVKQPTCPRSHSSRSCVKLRLDSKVPLSWFGLFFFGAFLPCEQADLWISGLMCSD